MAKAGATLDAELERKQRELDGGNDDADGSKDSRVDFNCPADGDYFVRVVDMLGRGGENFVYRIESEPFEPTIAVSMPEMLRRDNQYRKQFNIPRGNYYAMTVNMARRNMSAPPSV